MKTLKEYITIAEFLGNDMTEDQAQRLMDEAKSDLSISEIEVLMANVEGPLYACASEYNAEMGGLSRY